MRVAFIAAEAFPLAKVGGLADVVGSLPLALTKLGLEAEIYLPWYQGIEAKHIGDIEYLFAGQPEAGALGEAWHRGVRVVLLGHPDFQRERLYGYPDDVARFMRFSCMAYQAASGAGILHAHDWHAGLVPVLAHAAGGRQKTVFTIHNLAYQGRWNPGEFLAWSGLPAHYLQLEGLEYRGDASLMKGGIVYAHRVTTVSPSYAREILTPEFGEGLEGLLQKHQHKLRGILNGIDTSYWDPSTDPHLPSRYSANDLSGKTACRAALRTETGFNQEGVVLGVVSRLVEQKGMDQVLEILPPLLRLGCKLVVLGSGEPALEDSFRLAGEKYQGQVFFRSGHNEALAHRIYAGADALLIPSRFEPCGLTQMIAMRYGTPPIARAVGGLKDTIRDGVTGVLYSGGQSANLLAAIERFLRLDQQAMRLAGMRENFSWEYPALEYTAVYGELSTSRVGLTEEPNSPGQRE